MWTFSRSDMAAACACMLSETALGLPGLTKTPITPEVDNKPCSSCNCFATNVLARKLTPVTLPPGRFMLATRPNFTGSAPIANTIGMLEVAALAASAAAVAPPVAITANPPGDQVGRERRQPVELIVRPAVFNGDVPALDEAGRTEPLTEAPDIGRITGRRGRAEKPNGGRRRLLRASRERPSKRSRRRAAEQRYEFAAAHSITSSAAACKVRGTVRPSIFAVLRLITSSNLVGCSIGRSEGGVPLRMRAT